MSLVPTTRLWFQRIRLFSKLTQLWHNVRPVILIVYWFGATSCGSTAHTSHGWPSSSAVERTVTTRHHRAGEETNQWPNYATKMGCFQLERGLLQYYSWLKSNLQAMLSRKQVHFRTLLIFLQRNFWLCSNVCQRRELQVSAALCVTLSEEMIQQRW